MTRRARQRVVVVGIQRVEHRHKSPASTVAPDGCTERGTVLATKQADGLRLRSSSREQRCQAPKSCGVPGVGLTTTVRICRGGWKGFVGMVSPAALSNRVYKSLICRDGSQAAPANRFVGAAGVTSRRYKRIRKGG